MYFSNFIKQFESKRKENRCHEFSAVKMLPYKNDLPCSGNILRCYLMYVYVSV